MYGEKAASHLLTEFDDDTDNDDARRAFLLGDTDDDGDHAVVKVFDTFICIYHVSVCDV